MKEGTKKSTLHNFSLGVFFLLCAVGTFAVPCLKWFIVRATIVIVIIRLFFILLVVRACVYFVCWWWNI